MSGLDPSIVEHRIDTWPDITPVLQKQRPLHPSKAAAIKAEIDKLRTVGFIYPIAYTSWVSNPVPVDKKQGNIRVCTDFRDLNNACPKDNFPTPFIDQVIDECASHEALSFMDGFSGYNQIQIHPADQYKTAFITPWGTFAYRVMPFGLKNVGALHHCGITVAWPLHHPTLPHQRRIHLGLPRRPLTQGTHQWVIPQEILCLEVVMLL
jgi:hypothetical protein